jgi:hypothetical protein
MSPSELAEEKRLAHERAMAEEMGQGRTRARTTNDGLVYAAWGAVGIPLAWGVYRTALSVAKFFN